MLDGNAVVVVVPARDEERHIEGVLQTMPAFVDRIIVVDDKSTDATAACVRKYVDDARIFLVEHDRARGVGAAITSGYRAALAQPGSPNDAFCVMAGDGQMSPDDLERVARPIVRGEADYVKGNRFEDADVRRVMPPVRYWGGRAFSRATALAVGRRVNDSQCGFTAISRAACEELPLDSLWTGYGYPNDWLGVMVCRNFRLTEVTVRPLYGRESSGLRPYHGAIIMALILRAWMRRLKSDAAAK
jgi:glycosyltransferase involved in cell wall biosynthesis